MPPLKKRKSPSAHSAPKSSRTSSQGGARKSTSRRGGSKKSRPGLSKGCMGCMWAAVVATVVAVVLAAVVYFALPAIFYSIFNKVAGSYRPTDADHYDGIDVSHNNGTINWEKVAADSHVRFAYIKATEGFKYTDKQYARNIKNARKAGIKVGSYHVLTTRTAMRTQFNYFKQVADRDRQDILPMIDLEEAKLKGWNKRQLQDSLAKFVDMVEEYYCAKPVIYCSYKFYLHNLSPRFDDNILFLARYGKEPPLLLSKQHDIWQFTEHGKVNGINGDVDLDRFGNNTTLADILY